MGSVLANFESIETSGPQTHILARKSVKLIITNDSASLSLLFKFNESENFGTLKPTESISLYIRTKIVIIAGEGTYRIWSFG